MRYLGSGSSAKDALPAPAYTKRTTLCHLGLAAMVAIIYDQGTQTLVEFDPALPLWEQEIKIVERNEK